MICDRWPSANNRSLDGPRINDKSTKINMLLSNLEVYIYIEESSSGSSNISGSGNDAKFRSFFSALLC